MNAKAPLPPANSYLPPEVDVEVRHMDMQIPTALPHNWYDDNALITTFLNAMSGVFPDGERFFIQAVRRYQDQITDPELKRLIKAFIGQEAHHGTEHETFNALLEEQHGRPMRWIADVVKSSLGRASRLFPAQHQLAMTVALEHFTAILAHQALAENDLLMGDAPESVRDLFTWHAIEETEHKAVAFDVFKQCCDSYGVRASVMVRTTIFFSLYITFFQSAMLVKDRHIPRPREIVGYVDFLIGKKGFLRRMIPDYLAFYRRDFHPWEQDNSELIRNWREHYTRLAAKQRNRA